MAMSPDDILEHHGIKGMRWGVRKDKAQRNVKRRVKKFKSERKVKAKRQKIIANRRTLSDADIKKQVERFLSEKKLKDLVEADIKPGRAATKKILSESGQKVARTVVAGAGIILVKHLAEKKLGVKLDPSEKKARAKEMVDTLARGGLKKK